MKITAVQAIALAIPMKPLSPPSAWTGATRKQILVRVLTDAGLAGWGEAFAYGAPLAVCNVIDESLAPLLVGQDPLRIDALLDLMQRGTMIYGRRGLGMFAISGVEIALWDLAGKARNASVCELLGGAIRPRLPAYASLMRYGSPADVAAASRHFAAQGYRMLKLHQIDVDSVRAAREAVGAGIKLMLDTNCPWTPDEAIAMARALAPYRLFWLEEPVWPPEDYRGLARVAEAIETPIALGENESTAVGFSEIIDRCAGDILQ
ncbi:MAG TPA: mandelate racemase/muconate lactonizing enzyme family protein, partial [Methylomirabilota bacterium]|nr:mandelate racemase/muconate lactonizing enzyme family protein [Methylomirabilota bacterium]